MEFSVFVVAVVILGTLVVPRATFVIFWLCATEVVSGVFAGHEIMAAFAWIFFPTALMTVFLVESLFPEMSAALYVLLIFMAVANDLEEQSKRYNDSF
mgnify:FL=1